MGWFDDDDSSGSDDDGDRGAASRRPLLLEEDITAPLRDEKGAKRPHEHIHQTEDDRNNSTSHNINVATEQKNDGRVIENNEIDPLDAFMEGIERTVAAAKESIAKSSRDEEEESELDDGGDDKNNYQRKKRRLDWDCEDELWDLERKRLEEQRCDSAVRSISNEICDEEENLHSDNRRSKKQVIEPLPRVDHSKVDYDPFQKCFWLSKSGTGNLQSSACSRIRNQQPTRNITLEGLDITVTQPSTEHMNGRTEEKTDVVLPSHISSFDETDSRQALGLSMVPQILLHTVRKQGYTTTTPVQSVAIPILLSGHDVICTASTGSGKTLAFALPLVVHCYNNINKPTIKDSNCQSVQDHPSTPRAVVLSPTRELAAQTTKLLQQLYKPLGGRVINVTGGVMGTYELSRQIQRGCEVLCGTPGRILDMIKLYNKNNKMKNASLPLQYLLLKHVSMVILDEADKMLEMGFEAQVSSIVANVRPNAQRAMFSATFKHRIRNLAERSLNQPVRITVGKAGAASEHVEQHVIVLNGYEAKKRWVASNVPQMAQMKEKSIIFVSSKADCEEIGNLLRNVMSSTQPGEAPAATNAGNLRSNGQSSNISYENDSPIGCPSLVDTIHGDKHQHDRTMVMSAFKKGKILILVATDVASRGLDVRDVKNVINFDPAKSIDAHVHRIGRAGRLTKEIDGEGEGQGEKGTTHHHQTGTAYTLLTWKNADFANSLLQSFQREGRNIGNELLELAKKSKKYTAFH